LIKVVVQEAKARRQEEKLRLMKATRRLSMSSVLLARRRDIAQAIFDEVFHLHAGAVDAGEGIVSLL
jgi:hypothetical protein